MSSASCVGRWCSFVGRVDKVNDSVIHQWRSECMRSSCSIFDWCLRPTRRRHVDAATAGHGATTALPVSCPCLDHLRPLPRSRSHRAKAGATPTAVLRRRRAKSRWNGGDGPAAGWFRTDGQISARRAGFTQIYRLARRRRRRWSVGRTSRLLVSGTSQRPTTARSRHRPWRHLPPTRHVSADVRHRRSSPAVSK